MLTARPQAAANNLLNASRSGDFSLGSDLAKTFTDIWQYNFQTMLGPTNPLFVDAERGVYNEHGVLVEVDDYGNPTYEEQIRTIEQGEFLKSVTEKSGNDVQGSDVFAATDKTLAEAEPLANTSQVAESSINTTFAPAVSAFSTEASDPKKRIGNYYQEAGIYYKVTALGPQQVSLSEVILQRVWAVTGDGTAGWWIVDEQGKLNWAGVTEETRVVGDALWQIGPDGKDNYLRKAPTTDSTDPKNRIGNYYQEGGKYYKVTALGPQEVSLGEVIQQRVWAVTEDGTAGWWTVDEQGKLNWAGVTGAIRTVDNVFWQIGPDGKENYKGDVEWRLVCSSEGNYGNVTLYDENKNVIFSCPATSGRIGETDRFEEDKGPIPFGSYTLDPKEISGGLEKAIQRNIILREDWGFYRVPLKPQEGTNMGNRGEFFLHGGFFPGSAGCIDIGTNDRVLFPLLMQHEGLINVEVI